MLGGSLGGVSSEGIASETKQKMGRRNREGPLGGSPAGVLWGGSLGGISWGDPLEGPPMMVDPPRGSPRRERQTEDQNQATDLREREREIEMDGRMFLYVPVVWPSPMDWRGGLGQTPMMKIANAFGMGRIPGHECACFEPTLFRNP